MIGRVYRGGDVGGLVRYLYGPGRHNEHESPHLVAGWDAVEAGDLAGLEPAGLGGAGVDYGGLVAELAAPLAYAERAMSDPVWHCPLRTAPGDRQLSDGEWGEVARDLMHRTGIARAGEEGACRWVAVRHAGDHIHVVAVLARQDGAHPRLSFDHRAVRATCLAAEARYGLSVTAPADGTAARHTTRAEVERAARGGYAVAARDWLRTQVQHAAAASRGPGEFLDRLRAGGVQVKERRGEAGELTGYAVARPEPGAPTVFFGGAKLAGDLSLPRLAARWAAAGVPVAGSASALGPVGEVADRRELWSRATQAAGRAAEEVRTQHASDPDGAGDAAAAAAEVLAAASRLIEGDIEGPLARAARDYDRAARETYRRTPARSEAGSALRAAAYAMARVGERRPQREEAAAVALLVSQVAQLSLSVARLRQVQGRTAQAEAARRAVGGLAASAEAWSEHAETYLAERQHARTAAAQAPATGAGRTAGRPSSSTPGPRGRGR